MVRAAVSSSVLLCLTLLASCAPTETKDAPAPPAPSEKAKPSPLTQKVSFSFKHKTIGAAVRSLTVLTGVDISVRPEVVRAEDLEKKTVTLTVSDMSLRHALDWLVRQTGGGYQVGKKGCVWISRDYLPIDDVVTDSVFVPGLFVEEEAKDLAGILRGSVLPVGLKRDIVIGARSARNLIVVQAPSLAVARMKDVVNSLAEREPPPPVRIPERLEKVLEKKMLCRFKVTSLEDIVSRIRGEFGLNIGYKQDLVDARKVRRTLSMDAGHVTLKEALDVLVALTGFARWELEPERGVWLYSPGEGRHPSSAEIPWHGTVVRSYPVGTIVKRMEPRRLEDSVRAVCGRSSSSTLVKFSAATEKLLVIEEPRVLVRVEEYLGLRRLLSAGNR